MVGARRFWLAALTLITLLGVIQILTIRDETATFDEPVHIAAGYSYFATGSFAMNAEHPPLSKLLSSLPLLAFYHPHLDTQSEQWKSKDFLMVGNYFLYRNTSPPDTLLFAARLPTIALTLAFAAYLAWWTRRRFGPAAGLFALAMLVFDPTIITHGRYVTSDLAVTLFIFSTCTLWIEYLLKPRWTFALATGVSLGLALGSKYSAFFLPPVLMMMAAPYLKRQVAAALALVFTTSAAVLAMLYAPDLWANLPPLLPALHRNGVAGKLLAVVAATFHLPAYTVLLGLDNVANHVDSGHPSYLLGQVGNQGWWYYFPVAFAVKSTVAALVGLALLLALVWKHPQRRLIATILFPALVYFGLSMTSHLNIGIRHLLPVYPFLYAATAAVLHEHKRWKLILPLAAALECAAIYPDYLSFFNLAAGGPVAGHRYLLDSNLDWGQDYKKLARYLKAQQVDHICLSYFANVDFPQYGFTQEPIPEGTQNSDRLNCVTVVSGTHLFGQLVGLERFAWLRPVKPTAIIGHSLYVYDFRKKQ